MRHYDQSHFEAASLAPTLTPADYVRLLHPEEAIGKTTLMAKDITGRAHSKTYALSAAPALVDCFLDGDSYISLHRFHGGRKISRLAALNGLFLDLDVDRLPAGAGRNVGSWSLDILMRLVSLNLPEPSVLLSTGRGLAAIWLIDPLPPQALPRWQAAQKALIDLFRCLGADPSCSDAARVTRLPGSLNTKSQTEAEIIGGNLERSGFDQLADDIFIAAGRPTREQLSLRQKHRKKRGEKKLSGGLAVRPRFEAVKRDLERLRLFWGGQVPEGIRNTWLHLYATCLSHLKGALEIPDLVTAMAAVATPGLSRSEIAGIAKTAAGHASLPAGDGTPLADGRYHYSGATIAELLGVTAAGAQTLGLEQVMPKAERARRKAERQKQRRREAGAASREDWLQENSRERQRPWVALGMSRSTYYRQKKAGRIAETIETARPAPIETGPCPQQGGSASPEAPAEGRSPDATTPTPTKSAIRRTQPAEAQRKDTSLGRTSVRLTEIMVETNPSVQPAPQQGSLALHDDDFSIHWTDLRESDTSTGRHFCKAHHSLTEKLISFRTTRGGGIRSVSSTATD